MPKQPFIVVLLSSILLSACGGAEHSTTTAEGDITDLTQLPGTDANNGAENPAGTGQNTQPDTNTDTDSSGTPDAGQGNAGSNPAPDTQTPATALHWQSLRPAFDSNLCLQANDQQALSVVNCEHSTRQMWAQDAEGHLINAAQQRCADSLNAPAASPLQLKTCNTANSQRWTFSGRALRQDNQAMDVNRANAQVIIYPFHGGTNQQWQWLPLDDSNNSTPDSGDTANNPQPPLSTAPCPAGSLINALTPDAGLARYGSLFSSTLFEYDPARENPNNQSHQPQPVSIQVTRNGSPEGNCEVQWQTQNSDTGVENGWVFAESKTTDVNGKINAWWIAGNAEQQHISAHILRTDSSVSSAFISGRAYPLSTRSNSIHINWQSTVWDYFSVDVTPLTLPPTTYYSAINFPGGYTGLQSGQYLFSVWDVNGIDAQVIDSGIASCTGFGGEGTGAKCEVKIQPQVNNTYRFEIEVSYPVSNRTDYTLYFTDLSNGSRTRVAQLRYGQYVQPSGAAGFVEDWWHEGKSCLDTEERAAYFHQVRYKKGNNPLTTIKEATGSAVYNPWHNEICSNYQFSADGDKFLWSSGGQQRVGYPVNLPGKTAQHNRVTLP